MNIILMVKYSLIIPVYNRPEEITGLLESLKENEFRNYEIIVVEDGSDQKCEHIVNDYLDLLSIQYCYQTNSGPGPARNRGGQMANGEYLIFLDSDVIVPPSYFLEIEEALKKHAYDCFGGPDASHPSFTPIQKAISYSMTSSLTTGGIRGKKENMDRFYPRSFNLGIKKSVFLQIGGFSTMRFGEDLDLSMRLIEKGFTTGLIHLAFVYHKRRTSFKSFYKQVYNSGIARINLEMRHKGTLKIVHVLPSLFVLGNLLLLPVCLICPWMLILLVFMPGLFFMDALIQSRLVKVAFLAVPAVYTQLWGYGIGFMEAFIKRIVMRRDEFHSFGKNFYK